MTLCYLQEEYKDNGIVVEEIKPVTPVQQSESTKGPLHKALFEDNSEFVQMSLFDMLEQEQYQPKSASKEARNPFERY